MFKRCEIVDSISTPFNSVRRMGLAASFGLAAVLIVAGCGGEESSSERVSTLETTTTTGPDIAMTDPLNGFDFIVESSECPTDPPEFRGTYGINKDGTYLHVIPELHIDERGDLVGVGSTVDKAEAIDVLCSTVGD